MKIVFIIIILGILNACNSLNSDKKFVSPKTEIVIKGVKNIEDTNFVVTRRLLVGKWRESIRWIKQDSVWNGVKSLNLIHEYDIFPNAILIHRQIDIEHSFLVWTNRLSGFFGKSKNILHVLKNQRNDTVFNPGELFKEETKRIHLLNDTLLRIEEHFYTASGKYEFMIVDYKRVK